MRARFPRIEMLELVKSARATQFRNNGRVPYWMHLKSTAEILEWAFIGTQETHDDDLRDDLYCAALGHDLYEDKAVRREDIVAKFGPRVEEWIQAMTNDGDDGDESDRSAYLARLAAGPEEARLIKLADLIENMASCAYAIPDMGIEWTRNFFLPIATQTSSMLRKATFTTFRQTAGLLRRQMEFQENQLLLKIVMFMSLTPAQLTSAPSQPEYPREITAEEWARALAKTREEERKHAELFQGGRPFPIPSHGDDWVRPEAVPPLIADEKSRGQSHTTNMSIGELFASTDAANAAALVEAEAEARATGKELFLLSRLEALYGEGLAEREASLKRRYYVAHPEIRTLAGFVEYLCENEVWE